MQLVGVILLPITIFGLILLWQFSRSESARYRTEAEQLAAEVTADIDREVVGLTAALEALATSPALLPGGDLAILDAQGRALLRTRSAFVVLRDPLGQQLINTAFPYGTPLPRSTDPGLLARDRQVIETKKPVVSDLYTGTLTKRQLLLIDTPVLENGVVRYLLNIAIEPAQLSAILADDARPDWTISLIDRQDRIIARSRQQEEFVGKEATPDLRRAATGAHGTWEGSTIDGTKVLGAYRRSAISGWRSAVGIPLHKIEAPLRRLTVLLIASTLLVFLLSAAFAARIARSIAEPLGQLADAAMRLGRGEPVPALSTRLREVDDVARALTLAATEIQSRGTALQVSEERFRAAVHAVAGVVWTNDAAGRMTRDQPGWAALTGQTPDQYEGYGWSDALHPDDAAPTTAAWEAAVRERRTFLFEHRVRRHDGVYRRFSVRSVPVQDDSGTIREWVGVHTDITDEYEANRQLAESQSRLRGVFEAVPVGIVITEAPSGRVIDGNKQVERILRHPILETERVDGYRAWVSFHADGRQVESAEFPMARVITGGEEHPELEVHYRRGDGTMAWVRMAAAPIRDPAGRLTGGVVAIMDVDQQKRAEAALRELNATLERRVAETVAERDRIWRISSELMLISRADSGAVAVNPAWQRTLGWTPEELAGRRFLELVHPDDIEETLQELARLAAGATTQRFENRYRHRDGSYRWLSWAAVPEGGMIHSIARDITAEKAAAEVLRRTEEQLRQSQKMEVVGQLTGGVAHDFNNLLTVVQGNLEMAKRRLEAGTKDPRLSRFIGNAIEGAQRAAVLTHRLLAFARQSPLRPEAVDLNRIVNGMSELIRRTLGENIAIETVLAGGLWQAEADPNQVESAILNLCVNARDAMAEGGKLTIETGNTALDDAYPAVARGEVKPGQYVMVAVCDTGTGMAPEVQERVFEPFFTTKPVGKGTGLGLSQVFGFLRQSGGHAAIYSEPDQGTTVKLYFPRLVRDVARVPSGAEPAMPPAALGTGETIVLVEDEDMVREFAVSALEEAGYRVVAASDGPSGLALLDAHPEASLLFTDVVLAGPMNGRKVADEAQLRRPELKVLFTTGYTRNAIIHHGRLDEGVEVITKPFTASALVTKIRRVLG